MLNWSLFQEMPTSGRQVNTLTRSLAPAQGQRERFSRINLSEDAESYFLTALLPGIEPKSLDIQLDGKTLTISGERLPQIMEGVRWQRQERKQGQFKRAFELNLDLKREQISAEYQKGVLLVVLPKADKAKPQRIAIQTGH